jgi:site-specific DNA-methyltransferase (adenine-specific)
VAIEDAGFEIRDQLAWAYGSGFPKSHDVSKAIDKAAGATREKIPIGDPVKRMIPGADQNCNGSWIKDDGRTYQPGVEIPATDAAREWQGWGTALKPAWEPIVLARKPLIGTVAANVLEFGTGALNIDACRVPTNDMLTGSGGAPLKFKGDNARPFHAGNVARGVRQSPLGRFPANLLHDGSEEVVSAFPAEAGAFAPVRGTEPSASAKNTYGQYKRTTQTYHHGDFGGAARFFYCAKADEQDRLLSKHPTVKPINLMAWMCRLVTPPGGIVLDPFAGSGTTAMACMREGFRSVLIEREVSFVKDIRRRIAHVHGEDTPLFSTE